MHYVLYVLNTYANGVAPFSCFTADSYNGSTLFFWKVDRRQMGAYLCIASNDVPPAVSKRIILSVNCTYILRTASFPPSPPILTPNNFRYLNSQSRPVSECLTNYSELRSIPTFSWSASSKPTRTPSIIGIKMEK